ncbi:hypothetical protein EG68_05176 [Paragonimus skrjabini miyazakii]|uniref:Apple domain-containing protein n=1 Tax=Paragonimus skrjabini miyazakii TaxID=59628 RepID=A0A8S9YQQ4_9TREM|nr:hypothetical protein EG68_05176 [Paragonimus skrjabini miyazakii]
MLPTFWSHFFQLLTFKILLTHATLCLEIGKHIIYSQYNAEEVRNFCVEECRRKNWCCATNIIAKYDCYLMSYDAKHLRPTIGQINTTLHVATSQHWIGGPFSLFPDRKNAPKEGA